MVPQQLEQKLAEALPLLKELKRQIGDTLGPFADSYNVPFSGRVKTIESIAEKIETGRYKRFSEIDDLVAFTLVIPTGLIEERVVAFCRGVFDVEIVRDKRSTPKGPELFRFDSTRVIAKARPLADLVDLGNSIFAFRFEIQIRTAFEHAWSVATHDLVYKGSTIDWKRIRLAAQLKATTEGLDTAIATFDELAKAVTASPWEKLDGEISVANFVVEALRIGRIPELLKPASLTRFSQNISDLLRSAKPEVDVRDALRVIDRELNCGRALPISLSLHQSFLGILCEQGMIARTDRFRCNVTPELIALYPRSKELKTVFDYDS